jgi:serine/threonine protein kinase
MNLSRWPEADEILDQALALPAAERTMFLRRAAAHDAALLAALESVVGEAAREDGFLEPGAALAGALGDEIRLEPGPRAGDLVGAFRLVESIGSGGMGTVFRAARAAGDFDQQVAIKFIAAPLAHPDAVRRFRAERQILAALHHPNIVTLLDGGVTDEGFAYVVMEYVDGVPITAYGREVALPLAHRLRLFQQVCGAVQYAHGHFVVHRDLKPGNILVARDGAAKVLDFGVAKLLDGPLREASGTLTQAGFGPLTPNYASPEQIRGLEVTVTSDVYALGVILYELLTGTRPYETSGKPLEAVLRLVVDADATRPSIATPPDEVRPPYDLRRALRGDLDAIVLRALRKDPAERYASAEALSLDIGRYLTGQPVEAREPSLQYVARKLAARHKGVFATATLSLVAILSALFIALWQARQAARERDVAQEVSTFLEDLFRAPDPFVNRRESADTLRVRDFLARGADKVRQELRAQPAVQSRLLNTLGEVQHAIGAYDHAEPLLEEALRVRLQLYGPNHAEVANTQLKLGMVLRERGKLELAEPLLRASLVTRRALAPRGDADVAETLNELGTWYRQRGDYAEAVKYQNEALTILQQTRGGSARALVVLSDLVATLDEKADPKTAERYAREAVTLSRTLYSNEHPRVAFALSDLGFQRQRLAAYDDAEALQREALAIAEKSLGPDHPRVADILNRLASALFWRGDLATAETIHRQSLAIERRHYGERHLVIADHLLNLAQVLRAKRDFDEAEALNRESLAMVRAIGGDRHPLVAVAIGHLAGTLHASGDCRQAEPLYREALARIQRDLSTEHRRIPQWQRLIGDCLTTFGQYAEAEAILLESYGTFRAARGEDDQFTRGARENLIKLYQAWGKSDKAAALQAAAPQ